MGPTPATATMDFEESLTAPQPTPVPSWQGQGKGMEGGRGRRVVEAYHHQLQGWSRIYIQSSGVVCVAMRVMTKPAA